MLAVIFDGVTMEDFTSVDRLLSALRVYNMMQAVNMVAGVDVFNDGLAQNLLYGYPVRSGL